MDCSIDMLKDPKTPTVILPHERFPEGTNERSMRNLEFPLDCGRGVCLCGEHGFLNPVNGGMAGCVSRA